MLIDLPPVLTLQELRQDVATAGDAEQSVQGFLDRFVFPKNLEPIFVHDSHSVQYGDPTFPRVLLVTPNAQMTLSFAGMPDSLGWETLEVMNVDLAKTPRFQFAEIAFPKDSVDPVAGMHRPTWNAYGGPETRCVGCHGGGPGDSLIPVIPTDGKDLGIWGGMPAPWAPDVTASWLTFSRSVQPGTRYAPLRAWIESSTDHNTQAKISERTQAYLAKLQNWMTAK